MNSSKKKFNMRWTSGRSDDWQLIHGSLMTILMIFFMVLWTSAQQKKVSEHEHMLGTLQEDFGGKVDKSRMFKAINKEKEDAVAKNFADMEGLKKFTRIESDRESIKIIFPDPVIFSPGAADLKPETLWILGKIADGAKIIPDNEIVIEGHTDNTPVRKGGKFASNWELSLARSLSIIHYLIEVEGMKPERFIPVGYGEYRPLFDNDTPEDRAQNRRIEINILKRQ